MILNLAHQTEIEAKVNLCSGLRRQTARRPAAAGRGRRRFLAGDELIEDDNDYNDSRVVYFSVIAPIAMPTFTNWGLILIMAVVKGVCDVRERLIAKPLMGKAVETDEIPLTGGEKSFAPTSGAKITNRVDLIFISKFRQ